ncbi:S-layer homology domain-containing protein [Nostoc sp. TCL26-01]|uniref:S-layer homology domain-containing protein n=1 Tax=Nostoc sp. TCL26-01 TaxID=2576904 RepID=UPI0015B8AC0C|nr:S-layer homology domain-containing protein [Nostoc sp. TCL26-01]QLE54683.1 S-layer homology domain-containing protein [Nostoc sp. TCL26-01]
MTNKPPTESESSLGFDEFIAILVAFATIGGILFWSFSRKDGGWNLPKFLSPLATTSPSLPQKTPTPQLNPKVESDIKVLPSPPPMEMTKPNINQPPIDQRTPEPVLPPVQVVPINSPSRPTAPSIEANFSTNTSSLSLIIPAEKKSTIPPPIAFNDIPANFWASRFINALSSRKIIKGFKDYSFRPNQPVSRAEFAAILQQAFNPELTKSTTSLKDIPPKFWATPAINHAVSARFLSGYPNKTFKPQQNITRSQALVALVSGLNLKPPTTPNQTLSKYKDAKNIPKYAVSKLATASANGLIVNHPNPQILAPNQPATRAEVAVMIHQALVRMGKLEEIPSPNMGNLPPTFP